jgi:hypothetical protein
MTPMWKVVAHVLLPVIDLRHVSDALEQQNSTYPLELEVKLKNSLKRTLRQWRGRESCTA